MSVLIKGMDMPCSCITCRMECIVRIHDSTKRSKDCPLKKVTELKLEKDAFVSIENGGVVYFIESEEA